MAPIASTSISQPVRFLADYRGFVSVEVFSLFLSIQYVAMIIIAAVDATLGLAGVACWDTSRHVVMPRVAKHLAQAIKPMLCQARTVIVVDAYFNPSERLRQSKWLRPIHALAAALATDGRLNRFEVHALDPREQRRRWEAGIFAASCRADLSTALPPRVSQNAMLWRERNGRLQFHER